MVNMNTGVAIKPAWRARLKPTSLLSAGTN